MESGTTSQTGRTAAAIDFLERYSGRIILATVVLTLLLVIPLVALDSDEEASSDPSGDVFDLQKDLHERFQPLVHANGFVAESLGDDILTQAGLWELYQNTQELLKADSMGELRPKGMPAQPYLYQAFDTDTNRVFLGVNTLADEVQAVLSHPAFGTSLKDATDDQVKLAVHLLFSDPRTSGLRDFLSVKARSEPRIFSGVEIDYWTSPALIIRVLADNEKLGGGTSRAGLGVNETIRDKEEFNRKVQEKLRGDERTYRLWGFAIDQHLEAEDEGATAGMYIMFTVVAAIAVVGISLRSYWATALTGAGLGALMIWLKGISNLIGLEGGLVIDLIVPIAMIALGVDFAVHALRRYQEERSLGYPPERALRVGMAGVMGALVLAMLSDGIAFLSNTSSGIEAVIHFGIAAGIAAASSFIILGVIVPLAMMRIDRWRSARVGKPSFAGRAATLTAGADAAVLFGVGVILLVAVNPLVGVVVLLATTLAHIVVPVMIMSRRAVNPEPEAPSLASGPRPPEDKPGASRLVPLVTGLARYRAVVLPAIAAITAVSVLFALKLDPQFDVKDFFDSSSDFVVGLDKLDEHVAERSGEPATIYVRGDLSDPDALHTLGNSLELISKNEYVGRDSDGELTLGDLNVLSILSRITGSEFSRGRVAAATGVEIQDSDSDGVPDSREQIKAVYDYAVVEGVPLDENTMVFSAGEVKTVLFHEPASPSDNVAVFVIGIPGSREQTNVKAARKAITEDLEILRLSPAITGVGITGSPFLREGQLDATTKTLQTSLPIAAAAALALLLVAMRSLRYAVVTVIPVGLVVAWLLALMYLIGFNLNFVTATIGAISIGVGIDYSIHMTERFREEMGRAAGREQALRQAAAGSGVALFASAVSSIVGFTIMAFAPMPVISTFGILTAVMIFLALAASLMVLPSLLLLVTPEIKAAKAPLAPPQTAD